jgi:RsmE family RNA methyltransferase
MNLVLLDHAELQTSSEQPLVAVLHGARAAHLRDVLKVKPGSRLRVGAVDGGVGEGTVLEVSSQSVALSVELVAPLTDSRFLHLILALPRPQMLKRILEHAAACGVRSIDLIGTARVERSYFQSPLLREENLEKHLRLGLEQGMLSAVPEVQIVPRFHDYLAELDQQSEAVDLRLVADCSAKSSLVGFAHAHEYPLSSISCAVGPEGGWLPAELEQLSARKFLPFRLGDPILRVEAAVSAIWGQLILLRELQGALATRDPR